MNRGNSILIAIMTGMMFGVWINSVVGGLFMIMLLWNLAIIKTVK